MAECVEAHTYITDRGDSVFRFIHISNTNANGTLNSGCFSLRRDSGVSLGLASRIGDRFESFCKIKEEQGVARLSMAAILDLNLKVQSDPEPDWGEFADAHCILRGYQGLPKKAQEDIGRKLRDIANEHILKLPNGRII